jgi:hypothetical protein
MRRLAYTVHVPVWVDGPSGSKQLERTDKFLKGTELPEWAVPLVGDHVYEPGEAPQGCASPEPAGDNPAPAPAPDKPKRPGRPPKPKA